MCTKQPVNLRSVRVEYIKGKYAYKQRVNGLSPNSYSVQFSGPISKLKKDIQSITDLYNTQRSLGRLDKESRYALKGLQMNLSNTKVIESKGITHIIVYECLNK